MREDSVGIRIWKIIYPILIHFMVMLILQIMAMIFIFIQGLTTNSVSNTDIMSRFYASTGVAVLATAIITVPILYLFYARDKSMLPPVTNHYSKAWFLIIIVLSISSCLGVNYFLILSGITEIFSQDMELLDQSIYSTPVIFQIISVGIMGPIAEELVFRGLIFKRMRTYSNFVIAATVSSLIFAIYHGNVVQGIYAFIIGFLFCFSYEHFRNLFAPILFHCSSNTVSVLISYVSSDVEKVDGNIMPLILITAVTCIIAIICIIIIKVKIHPEGREALIDKDINNSNSML